MRRGLTLFVGFALLTSITVALAQQAKDPWNVSKVSKLHQARPGTEANPAEDSPLKYLHVEVDLAPAGEKPKLHKFRVTNVKGETVGELWGFNADRSLLIFEAEKAWSSLDGLYLDGMEHREPLFAVKAPPTAVVSRPPVINTPPVVNFPDRDPVVLDTPRPAYIQPTDRVYVPDRDRIIYRDDPDHVIVHDDPDRVIVHGDNDRVIVHDGRGRVVKRVVDDVDRVVIHDDDDVHVVDGHVHSGGAGLGHGGGHVHGVGSAQPCPECSTELVAGVVAGQFICPTCTAAEAPGVGPGPGEGPALAMVEAEAPGPAPAPGEGPGPAPAPGEGPGPAPAPGEGPGPAPAPAEGPAPAALAMAEGPGPGPAGGPAAGCATAQCGCDGNGSGLCGCQEGGACKPGAGGDDGPGEALPGMMARRGYDDGPGGMGGPDYGGSGGPGGPGYGGPGGPGYDGGYGGEGGAGAEMAKVGEGGKPMKIPPPLVLYISCGDDASTGKIFQVDDAGRVLGIVNLPYTATGLALHRDHGLVAAMPRDGGRLVRIDDTGQVSTIMENNEKMIHPIDVAVGADSDTIVVADNAADALMFTTTGGAKPDVYQQFEGQKWNRQNMSVAVTKDKHVIFGTNADEGIYRFSGDSFSASQGPLLPGRGGVAADTASVKWAASQSPNQVYVFEGEELMTKFRLPPNKDFYRHGLLSFAPAGSVVVAIRDSDSLTTPPWLIQYQTAEGKEGIRNLFEWDVDQMVDFVVGPRMYWDRNSPSTYRSIY